MDSNEVRRYNTTAISLHWLIAVLLIGLLALGKYMTGLEEADPLRYTLTQWHKSFGIAVLLLAVVRVIWRLIHKPPALPANTLTFERIGSHLTHLAMYVLMVVIPVSGWVMVSASPLNIKTVLFGVIPWPHIGFLTEAAYKGVIAERAEHIHDWLGNTLLVLVLMHVAAALLHQFVHKDRLINRMIVSDYHHRRHDNNFAIIPGVMLASALGLFLFTTTQRITLNNNAVPADPPAAVASDVVESSVEFTAVQSGSPLAGKFTDVSVSLSVDAKNPDAATLTAQLDTASVTTGDSQTDSTIVSKDWLDSEQFPQATFDSVLIEVADELSYQVSGLLGIRGVVKPIQFVLKLQDNVGSGEFTLDRSEYGIGDGDDFIEQEIIIRFQVQNSVTQ